MLAQALRGRFRPGWAAACDAGLGSVGLSSVGLSGAGLFGVGPSSAGLGNAGLFSGGVSSVGPGTAMLISSPGFFIQRWHKQYWPWHCEAAPVPSRAAACRSCYLGVDRLQNQRCQ